MSETPAQTKSTPAENYAVCNTCTIQLVELAYQRALWFRFLREPLRFGMIALSLWHRIDPRDYAVRTQSCYGCLRFRKTALKERSRTFRRLNDKINPLFDRWLETLVSKEEVQEAKRYARKATQGEVDPAEKR